LRIVLEAKCGLCGKKQQVEPQELTDDDINGKATMLLCTHCNNKLEDCGHLKALGGFLSAVRHRRKHIAPAFHAAKILMSVLERHYPWKFRICVIAEARERIEARPSRQPLATAAAAAAVEKTK
jgi:hypothetical protein